MVHHNTKDRAVSTKVPSGSESGVRKLTLSCSRCRASKLKCDKNEPCMECTKRNVGHLCTKDERQPRAKRAKTDHTNKRNNIKTNGAQSQEREAEETAQVLEHFVDGTSRTKACSSAILEPQLSSVAPDYPNEYWGSSNSPQRQLEKLALIREIVDAMPELEMIRLLYEVFVTRCQGPLGNITHTPTFMEQAEKLCGCLDPAPPEAQVMALSRTISMDALACHLLALVLALAFHPTPSLHGWSPTPLALRVEELRASDVRSKTWRSLAMRCLQGGLSLFCGSIAILQAAIMFLLDGQEGTLALDAILVAAVSGAQKLGLHRLGDARLEPSASHTSSSEDGSPTLTEPSHIRTEVGVRIWWALVRRDWSRALSLGYYSIHPLQFNTRMPLHINDVDLCLTTLRVSIQGHITERPRAEFTMLSYTVHILEIAVFARESIDLRGPLSKAQRHEEANEGAKIRNHLNKKYENFVAGLPSYFRLGSTVGLNSTGPMAAIPVHRWMLHQQLWSLFLRVHRASLSSQDGRASCKLLEQNIISSQAQIQARCAVCGSLSTSKTQLFNAAIILLVDLLLSSKHKNADHSCAQLTRLVTRDKICEAIELLRTQSDAKVSWSPQEPQAERGENLAQRSVVVLEALMKLEEDESGNDGELNGAIPIENRLEEQEGKSDSSARKSLKSQVMDTLEVLGGNKPNAAAAMEHASSNSFSALDMSMPLPAGNDGLQGLDVLPVLSNDPSFNVWQFLDFDVPLQSPTENDSFSATADLQTIVGSIPFIPSSGEVNSLSNFGTTESADMYSHSNGAHVTHMSSSSMESGPTKLSGRSEATMTP